MTASPEERFAALAVADRGRLVALAEGILAAEQVEVLTVPGPRTMLVELAESVQHQPFNLGEVVVSEASVSVRGHRGDGIVLGLDTERALAAAMCDAAAEAGLHLPEIDRLVAETEAARRAAAAGWDAATAATRIELEVLG